MNKIELLAPAGNLEKLKMAILYGADAVYFGGETYGLRASADNFSAEDIKEGIDFVHSYGKKAYMTMNIIPHNDDLVGMDLFVKELTALGLDAIILSDPGVLSIVKEANPDIEIHLSTQANNTNYKSAEFWHKQGIQRIILARELSFAEIKQIKDNVPRDLELEVFIHGAMCISYSGRCLLSNYMVGRDSNRGLCAHPCRWKYSLMEEKRPDEYFPVYENDRGTFIFNSKDLCMIEHIPELVESGVVSVKIEGRMKSSFYVATVIKAYRKAIDEYYADPQNYEFNPKWLDEISKASHREYTKGFYFQKPGADEQVYTNSSYIREYDFVGLVLEYDKATGVAKVEQRNRIFEGEEVEIVPPEGDFFIQVIKDLKNEEGNAISVAPHAQMILYIPIEKEVRPYTILRKKRQQY